MQRIEQQKKQILRFNTKQELSQKVSAILASPVYLTAVASSQLTGIDHFSTTSSPLVFVLCIVDSQASLLHILFHYLITRLFRSSSLPISCNSFFPFLIKFVPFILLRWSRHLSPASSRWFFISSIHVLSSLSKPFGFPSRKSFHV